LDRIGIPNGVELILVDDGSDPPIKFDAPYCRIVRTNDKRPWTWAPARNAGAHAARGDYLLMTDLDYIIPREAIDDSLAFREDKMRFRREFGVLDADGVLTQDYAALKEWGLSDERIKERGTRMPPHPNNFCIRKQLFFEMGMYRTDVTSKPYPQREDGLFKSKWNEFLREGRVHETNHRPLLCMFPNGQFCGDVDYNPHGLFHSLTRRTPNNPWVSKLKRRSKRRQCV
jgi:glycosyltransferase involved in cell wall biosynthesis